MRLNIKYFLWAALVFSLTFFACKKDTNPYFGNGSAVTLSSNTTTITASAKDSASTVLSLSWTNPHYATDSSHQKFLIQMDTTDNFTHPSTFEADGPLSQDYTGNQLNTVLASFGFSPGTPFTIYIRVISSYANNNEQYASNVVTVKMTPYTVPIVLKSSATGSLTLSLSNAANTAISFNWNASSFGSDTISYALQLDTVGGKFSKPQIIKCGSSLDTSFTNDALNNAVIAAGVVGGTSKNIEFRIISYISTDYTKQLSTSNVLSINISTYIPFVYLYVPGDYQGWTPATASTLAATVPDLTAFEGYVNIPPGGTYEFKFTPAPNFDASYGTNDAITLVNGIVTGDMSLSEGNNLTVSLIGGGYYRIDASTTANTWTADKTTWGLIGDFNGWPNNGPDFPMTYNTTTKQWIATGVNLTAGGGFKFRANNDWGDPNHNFGIDANGKLAYNAGNISVPATGTYTVILDLSSPRNYTYTLTKQ